MEKIIYLTVLTTCLPMVLSQWCCSDEERCYRRSKEPGNKRRCKSGCALHYGGLLAKVDSLEAHNYLYTRGFIVEGENFWLGLTLSRGAWEWQDGSALGAWTNWSPDPGDGKCVYYSGLHWKRADCKSWSARYICEKAGVSPTCTQVTLAQTTVMTTAPTTTTTTSATETPTTTTTKYTTEIPTTTTAKSTTEIPTTATTKYTTEIPTTTTAKYTTEIPTTTSASAVTSTTTPDIPTTATTPITTTPTTKKQTTTTKETTATAATEKTSSHATVTTSPAGVETTGVDPTSSQTSHVVLTEELTGLPSGNPFSADDLAISTTGETTRMSSTTVIIITSEKTPGTPTDPGALHSELWTKNQAPLKSSTLNHPSNVTRTTGRSATQNATANKVTGLETISGRCPNLDAPDFAFEDPKPYAMCSWTSWMRCDVKCGGGVQRRLKICKLDENCIENIKHKILVKNDIFTIGYFSQKRPCNVHTCPVVWTAWVHTSACTSDCGEGVRHRMRTTNTGLVQLDTERCDSPCKRMSKGRASVYTEADERPSAIALGVISIIIVLLMAIAVVLLDSCTLDSAVKRHLARRNCHVKY